MPDIAAIDAHAHVGRHTGPEREFVHEWYSGEATDVLRRADAARTRRTAVSTYLAVLRGPAENVLEGNRLGAELAARREGLLLWAVVNPRDPRTFEQADELLASPKCVGVKIHPETHDYTLAGFGDALFAFAAERKALILTHSGDRRSAPEDFIPYADAYPEARLILAHLGDSADGDPTRQVRAIQAARQGNVLTDTSGLASMRSGLLEWAVREIGPERILYATDSPCYFAPAQRARIDHAEIDDDARRLILHDNAAGLLGLAGEENP